MSVTREDLTPERVAEITEEMRATGKYNPYTPEEREQTLQDTLARVQPGEDVWMFGYGSLMWNPMVHYAERRYGLIHGFRRRYCFWVRMGRGSPELPGLMLGLDRGGSCRGMAFRIPAAEAESELRLLWRREMLSGAYRPTWVTVRTELGTVPGVTFVANPDSPQFVRGLSPETAAAHIAQASGWLGTCREYLEKTVRHLGEEGFSDRYLSEIYAHVRAIPPHGPAA